MKFWILKKLVLFLKWFVNSFHQDIRILISQEPKRVILHRKANITFLGDFITFYNCKTIRNCRIFHTKESWNYAYDNFDPFYLYYQCSQIAYCSHQFLKNPKDTEMITRDDKVCGVFHIALKEKKYSRYRNINEAWHRYLSKRNPASGVFSYCTRNRGIYNGIETLLYTSRSSIL